MSLPPHRKGSDSASQARYYVFPYREEEEVIDAVAGTKQRLLRPTLDVEISHEDLTYKVRALIDTGAPRCLFPRGIGDALRVDFSTSIPRHEVKILGAKRTVVRADVTLSVPNVPELWWHTEASFFDIDWDDIRLGLLGDRGFLNRCVVSFHRSKNHFVIETIDEWERRLRPDPAEEFLKDWDGWDRPKGA